MAPNFMKTADKSVQELPRLSHDNNMGFIRYYLALSVVMAHLCTVMGIENHWPTSSYNAVGGFFALSGFLVYGSYLRAPSLKHYIKRRARRILPPYFTTVLLCAFGLIALSTLSAGEYFTSPQWWKYLVANLSFLNFIEPELPGVFTNHEITAVNGSLWTMKIEWMLYLSVPIVAWCIRKIRKPALYTFIAIYIISLIYRITFYHLYEVHEKEIYMILCRQVFGQLMYFYTGVAIYFNLNRFLKYKWHILVVAVVLCCLQDLIPYYEITVGPIVVSSLVLWFSLIGKWGRWANRDNFSYDIYLSHLPVIQVIIALGIREQIGTLWTFIISIAAILLIGAAIWFGVGKRFMRR